ncbi:MAG: alkaline phosphatase D family protein [Bacteroidota bacterium]
MKRKEFLKNSIYLGAGLLFIGCLSDTTQIGGEESSWRDGDVAHILPTVNHSRMLISTSYKRVVRKPRLKVGSKVFSGQMRDTKGYFWQFDCQELEADTAYQLQVFEGQEALCDSWELKTFPAPDADAQKLKLMIYTCAGGHPESVKFFPIPEDQKESPASYAERRIRLLNRGLSFKPDAVIMIGDQVYWDLSGNGKNRPGTLDHPLARSIAPPLHPDKPVLGTENEEILKKVVNPQIIDLYGTACRSTPVFFFKDDHDYFENDEANENLITFPPKAFQLELARTLQQMYTPAFLPDEHRPLDLAGSGAKDRVEGASESFGTLRYGKLAELLMYDCRRFVSLAGENAQFLPASTEKWLKERTYSQEVKHTIHIPSTPFGWSAGKWGEWYADILGKDGQLRDDLEKPYWQKGWKLQHDRILESMYKAKHKKPIMISGDLHAFASGRIYKNEEIDFSDNPIHAYLAGPLGNNVFPSTFRKVKASVPNAIAMEEDFDNVEENGFSMVDIDSRSVSIKMFKFLFSRDDLANIPELEPFVIV